MLHRRTTSTAPAAGNYTPNLPTNLNNTYTPLRRPSQQLYNTPSSAPKARYALPSPSLNYLSPGTGPAGYTQRQSIDLGDQGFESAGSGGWEGWVNVGRKGLERFKDGLRDGLKLNRSLTLVWG